MSTFLTRLGDRLLTRFVPAQRAAAVNCVCECSDKCYPCCPQLIEGETVIVCHKDKDCRP